MQPHSITADGIRLVAEGRSSAEMVEADDGQITYLVVDLGSADRLEVRTRRAGRKDGRVRLTLDGHLLCALGAGAQFQQLQLPVTASTSELRLRLQGAAVDTLLARTVN